MPLTAMVPDRAGVKMTLWDWAKFIGAALWNLPAVIASRPAVVDERLASVSSTLPSREISV
jgi:carboxymethylenebutenolidase